MMRMRMNKRERAGDRAGFQVEISYWEWRGGGAEKFEEIVTRRGK